MRAQPAAIEPHPTLSREQFAGQLETLASAIDAADSSGATRLASSLPAAEHVAVDGGTIEVRFDWLRAALRASATNPGKWNSQRGELASRLRAMTREARATTPEAGQRAAARAALNDVLADPRFRSVRADVWRARLREWLGRWLSDAWERTLGRRAGQRSVAVVLAWGASIAAIVVLLVWLARLETRRRAERPLGFAVTPHPAAGRELALQAAALVRAGHVREGARLAYRAAVQRLEEEGAFQTDESRTPREYLRLLSPPHRRRATLAALTLTFERIWYGSRAAGPDDGAEIVALLQDLECLARDHAN